MFNNQENNEADFCESYKTQVLGKDTPEKSTSLFSTVVKLLIILLLLTLIAGVSFYGYTYFTSNQKSTNELPLPPASIQVSEDDAALSALEEANENTTEAQSTTTDTLEMNQSNQDPTPQEEIRLEVPSPTPEAKYLEELADLSKEIDKETKK